MGFLPVRIFGSKSRSRSGYFLRDFPPVFKVLRVGRSSTQRVSWWVPPHMLLLIRSVSSRRNLTCFIAYNDTSTRSARGCKIRCDPPPLNTSPPIDNAYVSASCERLCVAIGFAIVARPPYEAARSLVLAMRSLVLQSVQQLPMDSNSSIHFC